MSLAAPVKPHYKVTAAGGTTWTTVGDHIELTLGPGMITAVDKECPPILKIQDQKGNQKIFTGCPPHFSVTLYVSPSKITAVEVGAKAHYVSITWLLRNGHKKVLIFRTNQKNYSEILAFLETATGKKAIDADTAIGNRPRVIVRSGNFTGGYQGSGPPRDLQFVYSALDKECPSAQLAKSRQDANFTFAINNVGEIQQGPDLGSHLPLDRNARITIFNQSHKQIGISNGDSIGDAVIGACTVITKEWALHHQ